MATGCKFLSLAASPSLRVPPFCILAGHVEEYITRGAPARYELSNEYCRNFRVNIAQLSNECCRNYRMNIAGIIEWILHELSNEYYRNYRMNITRIIEWILPELSNEYAGIIEWILHELSNELFGRLIEWILHVLSNEYRANYRTYLTKWHIYYSIIVNIWSI